MGRLNKKLIVSTCFALSSSAFAATKDTVSFKIIDGWSDGGDIYVLYDRKNETVRYSLFDIHGAITKSENARFYRKLDKNIIEDNQVVDLTMGTPSPGLIYMDSEFLIRAEGENVYVKNRTNEISVDCDAKPWNRPNPVRLADALLYCGNIIHLSGEKTESLPATLQAKVSEFVTRSFVERDRGTKPGVAAFAEDRGQLKIAALNTGMDDAPLGYMSIDTATFKDKGVVTLPFSGKDFRILNNYRAFFRTGLVIQPRARSPRSIHTCISSTCETVILSGTYEFMWIEDDGRTLYLLERENVATPIIKLKIIRK